MTAVMLDLARSLDRLDRHGGHVVTKASAPDSIDGLAAEIAKSVAAYDALVARFREMQDTFAESGDVDVVNGVLAELQAMIPTAAPYGTMAAAYSERVDGLRARLDELDEAVSALDLHGDIYPESMVEEISAQIDEIEVWLADNSEAAGPESEESEKSATARATPAAKGIVADALAEVREYVTYLGRQVAGPGDTTRASEIAVRLREIEARLAEIAAAPDPALDDEAAALMAEAEDLRAEYDAIGYDKAGGPEDVEEDEAAA